MEDPQATNQEKLKVYLDSQPFAKLNTGIRYHSKDMTKLQDGAMYLGVYHGRSTPDEVLNDWGSDGNVYGPISRVIVEDYQKITLIDLEGNNILLPFLEDMVCLDGKFYGDMTLFVQGVSIPLFTSEKFPVAGFYRDKEEMQSELMPALYVDLQMKDSPVHTIIGPCTAVHTTYLYHIRANVNHISGEWPDLNFNSNKIARLEYFVKQ